MFLFLDPEFILWEPEIQRILIPLIFISQYEYLCYHLHISCLHWKKSLRNIGSHFCQKWCPPPDLRHKPVCYICCKDIPKLLSARHPKVNSSSSSSNKGMGQSWTLCIYKLWLWVPRQGARRYKEPWVSWERSRHRAVGTQDTQMSQIYWAISYPTPHGQTWDCIILIRYYVPQKPSLSSCGVSASVMPWRDSQSLLASFESINTGSSMQTPIPSSSLFKVCFKKTLCDEFY